MRFLFLVFLLVVGLVGCGKNNQSGKNSSSNTPVVDPLGIPGSTANQQALLSTVMKDYPCLNGLQRFTVQVPINMSVALNSFYVGVTSEGDVAVVTSNNGTGVFTAHICGRQSVPSGQGQLLGNPVVNRSYRCAVDEITAAKMTLANVLMLNFRAIHFGHGSSLCH